MRARCASESGSLESASTASSACTRARSLVCCTPSERETISIAVSTSPARSNLRFSIVSSAGEVRAAKMVGAYMTIPLRLN
mgnify:CR=1 FL=1